jgi:hypothetical protein
MRKKTLSELPEQKVQLAEKQSEDNARGEGSQDVDDPASEANPDGGEDAPGCEQAEAGLGDGSYSTSRGEPIHY